MNKYLDQRLCKLQESETYRTPKHYEGVIDFASNDYLGFARSEKLKNAFHNKDWKTIGSTGSRLLTGHSDYIEQLERKMADFHNCEDALIYSSGFMANLGLLSAVAGPKDLIFYDTDVHASVKMGIKLSHAHKIPWKHQDLHSLEKNLKKDLKGRQRFVCVESIYSCDGTITPLQELTELCERYHACLIVDEAHSTGIFGKGGEGLVQMLGLEKKVWARVHTFSKALGVHGAAVVGDNKLKRYLLNCSIPQIYTTTLPFPTLFAIDCAYDLLPQATHERTHLFKLMDLFHGKSPINTIKIKGNKAVCEASKFLLAAGFDVRPLRSPTVRVGQECLRIILHAFNTYEEISNLKKYLRELL